MVAVKSFLRANLRKIVLVTLSVFLFVMSASYFYCTRKKVTFLMGLEKKQVFVYGYSTTANALAKAGIELGPYDKINVALDHYVSDKDTIYITEQQAESVAEENYALDALTVSVSSEVFIGEENVIATSGGFLKYKEVIEVVATGYCSCPICCGPYDGNSTANGSHPYALHTVAAPRTYAFGTHLYIPYYNGAANHGLFEVEDRGGAIQGNRIDIYFNTHEEALKFGRRTLTIYILN